jgi:predicted MPP superfamily phosphohydrolase
VAGEHDQTPAVACGLPDFFNGGGVRPAAGRILVKDAQLPMRGDGFMWRPPPGNITIKIQTMPVRSPKLTTDERAALTRLEARVGHLHIQQRLGLEQDLEARASRRRTHFFQLKNWYASPPLIKASLCILGLRQRGRRNALNIALRQHDVPVAGLPAAFDGYTILHLSDLHLDISAGLTDALVERVRSLRYDLCVMTGDYRAATYGPFENALAGLERLRPHISAPIYAILGNHDSIRMVQPMEAMGYHMLINEWARIERDGDSIWLSGVDDAHYYQLQNFDRAAQDIPRGEVSVLLSHTPEMYRLAAHADFNLMLCGHTHGGQICLPGGVPIVTDADSPRRFARGSWRYHDMIGYTSVGAGCSILDVRFNCAPEVTLHRLRNAS